MLSKAPIKGYQKNNFNSFNFPITRSVWDHQTLGKNHSAYLFFVEIPPISHRWATICWVPSWNCPKNSLPQRQLHPESWQQPLIFDSWNMWQKKSSMIHHRRYLNPNFSKKNSLCVPESTRMSEVPSTWTKQIKTQQTKTQQQCLPLKLPKTKNQNGCLWVIHLVGARWSCLIVFILDFLSRAWPNSPFGWRIGWLNMLKILTLFKPQNGTGVLLAHLLLHLHLWTKVYPICPQIKKSVAPVTVFPKFRGQ